MEKKKNPKYDLERFRALFFTTALVLVLTAVSIVINLKQKNRSESAVYSLTGSDSYVELKADLGLGNPQKKQNPEKLRIVDDKTQLPDTVETESDKESGQEQQQTGSSKYNPLYAAEYMPEYPGGTAALRRDLAKAVKLPKAISSGEITGQMYVQFVVTSKGHIDEIKILQSIYEPLDTEVMKALKKLKVFKPASQNGKPVAVYFILPLSFNL